MVPTLEQAARERQHVQPQVSKFQHLDILRKTGRVAKFRTKQILILCRRNEYGITDIKRNSMIKYTYLYRELMLRLDARKITEKFYRWKEKGMFDWKAYQKHRESFRKLFGALRHALARYRDRRIKAGYFYMCKHRSLHLVFVMSPLYTMPRKEALMKIRQILHMREAYDPTRNKITLGAHVWNLAQRLCLLYFFVIIMACIIIFCG